LLTANRDFFWVSVFDDQSQTGLREPQAFRTTDGALIGPVRCAQVIPLGRPPACDLLQPSSALEHIYRPSVVGGGRRVVLTTPQSVDLYDVSGVTDLTATLVKRVPLSSSATSTVVDADDVGNIVLAGSTPSDVVFVPAAAALGTVGTALVQERAFAARNPGGRVGLKVTPYVPFELQVTGVDGVPDGDVAAVSLNVTVTEPDASGFLTVYPCGERKVVSSLNYVAGQTVPNAVIAPVSPRGTVCFYAQRSTHLLADVNGWFAAGSGYTALDPVRVFDTR
jgi:hypothetical protein